MEHKYKKFKKFNFAYSDEWKAYYRNIFPTPPISKLLHYKKKFYRNYIDPDFDINYIPPEGEKEETVYTPPPEVIRKNRNKNNNNSEKEKTLPEQIEEKYEISKSLCRPINNPVFKLSELLLLFGFILSLPIRRKTAQTALFAFGIKTFREVGIPELKMSYFKALLLNENFHNLIYLAQCYFDNFTYYMLLPICLSTIIAISENLIYFNVKIKSVENYVNSIIKVKEKLMQDKAHLEVGIGFLLIIGTSMKLNTFKTPIIYWQVLRFKYLVNPYINYSFVCLNNIVDEFKNGNKCPKILKIIIDKLQILFCYLGNMGQKKSEKKENKENNDDGNEENSKEEDNNEENNNENDENKDNENSNS